MNNAEKMILDDFINQAVNCNISSNLPLSDEEKRLLFQLKANEKNVRSLNKQPQGAEKKGNDEDKGQNIGLFRGKSEQIPLCRGRRLCRDHHGACLAE